MLRNIQLKNDLHKIIEFYILFQEIIEFIKNI